MYQVEAWDNSIDLLIQGMMIDAPDEYSYNQVINKIMRSIFDAKKNLYFCEESSKSSKNDSIVDDQMGLFKSTQKSCLAAFRATGSASVVPTLIVCLNVGRNLKFESEKILDENLSSRLLKNLADFSMESLGQVAAASDRYSILDRRTMATLLPVAVSKRGDNNRGKPAAL